ncbi:MAG: hypothetical protein ACRD3O_23415, partial [Terriglobia bacterium]
PGSLRSTPPGRGLGMRHLFVLRVSRPVGTWATAAKDQAPQTQRRGLPYASRSRTPNLAGLREPVETSETSMIARAGA